MWGAGKEGRLGTGTETDQPLPRKLDNWLFKDVQSGYHHNLGLSETGRVYSWGRGVVGQLGHNSFQNSLMPQQISSLSHL